MFRIVFGCRLAVICSFCSIWPIRSSKWVRWVWCGSSSRRCSCRSTSFLMVLLLRVDSSNGCGQRYRTFRIWLFCSRQSLNGSFHILCSLGIPISEHSVFRTIASTFWPVMRLEAARDSQHGTFSGICGTQAHQTAFSNWCHSRIFGTAQVSERSSWPTRCELGGLDVHPSFIWKPASNPFLQFCPSAWPHASSLLSLGHHRAHSHNRLNISDTTESNPS